MRWQEKKNKKKIKPSYGQVRTITRFAFIPTKVHDKWSEEKVVVWLETYKESQKYTQYYRSTPTTISSGSWETINKFSK